MGAHPWPDGQFDRVKALAKDGLSASMIAAEIGNGLTRNAVIGKLFRAGLPCGGMTRADGGRVRFREPKKNGFAGLNIRRRQKAKEKDPGFAEPQPAVFTGEPVGPIVSLEFLDSSRCRWPIGDPRHASFGYCGHPVKPESAYCAHHFARSITGFGKARYGSTQPANGYVCKAMAAQPDYQDKSLKSLNF